MDIIILPAAHTRFLQCDLRKYGFGRKSTGETDPKLAALAGARILTELLAKHGAPEPTPTGERKRRTLVVPTVGSIFREWEATLGHSRSGRGASAAGNRQRAHRFVEWAGEDLPADRIDTQRLSQYFKALAASGMVPGTVIRYRVSLSAMLTWAAQSGYVRPLLVAGSWRPKEIAQKKFGPSREVIEAALKRTEGRPLHAVYLLAYFSGLRRSEIARARYEHVNHDADTILADGMKTEGSIALLPLHPRLKAYLVSTGRTSGPIVAKKDGGHYAPNSLQKLRTDFRDGSNVPLPRLPPLHVMRHAMAGAMLDTGASYDDVSLALRHTSNRTAKDFYTRSNPERFRGPMTRF